MSEEAGETKPPPDTTGTGKIGYKCPPRAKKIIANAAKIVELAVSGVRTPDIAKVVGQSERNVDHILTKFSLVFKRIEEVADYRKVRGLVLEAAELQLLESVLAEGAIAKAPLNQRAYALDIVHKIRRLESGQSTSNISTRSVVEIPQSTTFAPDP